MQKYLREVESEREARTVTQCQAIAVSRECFSLGTSTCRELAGRLGWPVYGYDVLELVAKEMKVSKDTIDAMDEKGQHWLRGFLRYIEGLPDQNAFVIHLKDVLTTLHGAGSAIFIGRAASVLLPKGDCLRVRIVADHATRVKRCMERLQLDRQSATKKVDQTDGERAAFLRTFFHMDIADPHHYDLVLNSDQFPSPACAALILDAFKSKWPDAPIGLEMSGG